MREDFQLQMQEDTDDGFSRTTYEEAIKGMQSLEGEWDSSPLNENLHPGAERERSPKRRREVDEEENQYPNRRTEMDEKDLTSDTNTKFLRVDETLDRVRAGTMSPKRRTEVTTIQDSADVEMDVPGPPVKSKNQPVPPVIEVTPAVENWDRIQLSKRRTSPVILDMDVDEHQAVSRIEENVDHIRPGEVAIPMEEDLGLLP